MTSHYVDIYPEKGVFNVKCSCGSLKKKYATRSLARSFAHLHVAGIDVDLLELALAGKAGHG